MAPLPVRDIADVPLAELFEEPGCPLCRRVEAVTTRFIDAMLYESVNDIAFRRDLDAARGFCARHTYAVLAGNRGRTGGSLSSAILFAAILRVRLRELAEVSAAGGGRGRGRRVEVAARAPDCPICAHAARALAGAAESLGRLSADAAWAEALSGAPFCVAHLVLLMSGPRKPDGWAAIEARQTDRLGLLLARLDGFAHHSSEDRRHLQTDDERSSVDEAAAALGGSP